MTETMPATAMTNQGFMTMLMSVCALRERDFIATTGDGEFGLVGFEFDALSAGDADGPAFSCTDAGYFFVELAAFFAFVVFDLEETEAGLVLTDFW